VLLDTQDEMAGRDSVSQRACANPLCEHFWRMVQDGWDHFAWVLQEEVPSIWPAEESFEINTRRLGRKLYRWCIAPEDQKTTPQNIVSRVEWRHNFEKYREDMIESYYFCDNCDEVLIKATK